MDNLNDLKQIWLTANTGRLPKPDEVMQAAKKFRNQKLRKKMLVIAVAIFCVVMMLVTLFVSGLTMLTTRLGGGLIIIAALILAFTNLKSIGRFYYYKDYNNKEFIEFLEQTRRNQVYFYKKTQVAGLAFSSAGLLLYIFELAYKYTLAGIIAYVLVIVFLAVDWLIIRPRNFKKQDAKMNSTLEQLKKIANQL